MQAIMLAAGKGSRLGKYTKNNTKCMLEVNNIKLIDRAISALQMANIKKLILVLGYKKENVKEYLQNRYKDMEIIFVDNDIYDQTNNIYSLYLAKDYFVQDDTILLESDLIYENDLIKKLCEFQTKNAAVVAKYDDWMDGTVITKDAQNNILKLILKNEYDWSKINEYYKTVNIYKFSKDFIQKIFLPAMVTFMFKLGGGYNNYYEIVLKNILNENVDMEFKAYTLETEKWYEIDNEEDLNNASRIFKLK